MKGFISLSSINGLPTVNSPDAVTPLAWLSLRYIIGLSGSSIAANSRFFTVYSWPQKRSVSLGNAINFYRLASSWSHVPSSRRPHPPTKSVSPQNKNGFLSLSGVTCVTIKLQWSLVWPGVSIKHKHMSPIVIVERSSNAFYDLRPGIRSRPRLLPITVKLFGRSDSH